MIDINKFVIGVRVSSRMFRVSSLSGTIIDSVLAERGKGVIDDEYYSQVNGLQNGFQLTNKDNSNSLTCDIDNVVFTKDYYEKSFKFNYEKLISEFHVIWKSINDILKVRDIRRVGIMAEHKIKLKNQNPSKTIMKAIANIDSTNHPAKFLMRYEERLPTKEGLAPDIKKSDFINIIRDYYDSENDADHPSKESVNINLDVQRYYSPLLTSNVPDEVGKLYRLFLKEKTKLDEELKRKGIV